MPTGEPVEPDVVQSWVDTIWPLMLAYHPGGISKRMITAWWTRVRPDELEKARERLRVIREHGEREELAVLQNSLNAAGVPPGKVVNLFAGTVRR